jgi:hypothetical protein
LQSIQRCEIALHFFTQLKIIYEYLLLLLLLKGKIVPVLNLAPRHEGVLGEWRYSSTHSLSAALDGGEWSASSPGHFTPRERDPGTYWVGGWVGPRDILDTVVKRKIVVVVVVVVVVARAMIA